MGIETSCDETAVSIVEKKKRNKKGKILGEIIHSQIISHKPFGGVVPEISSREHIKYLDSIVKQTLKKANVNLQDINAFASTAGPGLLGGLLIGTNYCKSLSLALKKPFFAINHLQAHALLPRMDRSYLNFPFLVLLISGGHTQILLAKNYNHFDIWGTTLDDALGEAFDKTAKLLELDYPGGPQIEKFARLGNSRKIINFPRPLNKKKNCDFSFSGLKTAVRKQVLQNQLSRQRKIDIAYNFQNAVLDCLVDRCNYALSLYKKKISDSGYFVISGGVASNLKIRNSLKRLSHSNNFKLIVPDPKHCVDNATMIAWTGIERITAGEKGDSLSFHPKPRWPLNSL